jgi:acyl-CoA thioesterase I
MMRICFVGASNVEGQGDATGKGWVGGLAELSAAAGASFVTYNLGVRGQTLAQITERAVVECAPRLPKAASGLIVLATGLNDFARVRNAPLKMSLENAAEILTSVLPSIQAIAPLIVLGPTPVCESKMPMLVGPKRVSVDLRNADIAAVNARYSAVCDAAKVSYLDLFDSLRDDQVYQDGLKANDGLHPNSSGYRAMAALVFNSTAWTQLGPKN